MAVHGLACHQPHVSFMSVFLCLSVSVCLSSYLTYTYTTWLFSDKWRIICSSFIKFEIITIWKNIVAWIGTYISEKNLHSSSKEEDTPHGSKSRRHEY